ncbi:MAG: DUF3048 domain-containing protein [Anaerolineae bacterium]|nr:DUF3048 domain-containing protein [Anaerolineae bacterium]
MTRRSHALIILVTLALFVSSVAGCAASAPATPTPTKTPRVEVSQATAAPEPSATPTDIPLPTVAPIAPPTDTPAPPAATDTPVAESAASTAGSDTQASSGSAGSASGDTAVIALEPGVSFMTGLRPDNPAVLDRRPLAIKVDNDPAVVPQSGLNKADIVVEHPKERCMTRFTAIYQSQDAPRVGSIRSARIVDQELPVIFDAILGFSGSVEPVRQMIYKSDIGKQVLEQARNGGAYFRDPNIRVPFNLFANTDTMWKVATQKGLNTPPKPTAAWVFSEGAPAGGKNAATLAIPYPQLYKVLSVGWRYDAGSGRYLRTLAGKPAIDKADGKQISAANVVVLLANTVETLIPEQGNKLVRGGCQSNASVEIQLWGSGPVKILRDGKVYEGKWVRDGRRAPFRFVDAQGKDIPLKPGNSWWQIVPSAMPVTIQ